MDSSVLVALALGEAEQPDFLAALATSPINRISAGTWLELAAVAVRRKLFELHWLDRMTDAYRLRIEPVTAEQAAIGRDAYRSYGLGSGHPARLNFGDCFSYALAKATGEPLLFKGDDFIHTDVIRAI